MRPAQVDGAAIVTSAGVSYHAPTFAGFPRGNPGQARPGMVVAGGLIAESFESRPGTTAGPAAVRAAAARFIARIAADPSRSATDRATGRTLRIPTGDWNAIDVGDIEADGTDFINVDYCAEQIYKPAMAAGALPLVFGGDGSVTTTPRHAARSSLGFLHVSPSLAGAEDPDGETLESLVGVRDQYPELWARTLNPQRCRVSTTIDVQRDGIETAARGAIEHLARCDGVVVGIDMGVVDAGHAAGSPTIGIGGLAAQDLLVLARMVSTALPLKLIMIGGIAPGLDSRGRTEALAARVAIELIAPRVFA